MNFLPYKTKKSIRFYQKAKNKGKERSLYICNEEKVNTRVKHVKVS